MPTYEIPTANGYTTVKAKDKASAVSSVSNAKLNVPTVPTTLNSKNMNTNVTKTKLPTETTPTAGAGIAGAVEVAKNSYKDESARLLEERKAMQESRSNDLKTTISDIMDVNTEIANVGNTVDRTAENEARKKVDSYTSQIEQEQLALRRKQEAIQKNSTGMLAGAVNDELQRAERESYSKQADLAILQSAANRDYETANSIADRAVALKLEPLQTKLSNLEFFYKENKETFNTEDDRLYSELIKKQEKELAKEEEFQTVLKNVKFEIAKQGGGISMLSKLNTVQSLDDLLKIPGISTYLSTQEEKYNLMKLKNDAFKGVPAKYAGEFGATIDQVANMESSVYGKQSVAEQLKTAIANKDYTSAYAQIAQSVENGLTGEPKTLYSNARTAYPVMLGLRDAIKEYKDADGDMGLLKGSAESIVNKLGRVQDPKYKALATQLETEFQKYRQVMTGAAFSPQESKQYASVVPTGNKSLNLNLAIIEGALSQLENRVQGTINARVPSARYILEYATNPQLQQQSAGSGQPVNPNNPIDLPL